MFTQPTMYKAISKHPHVLTQYSSKLIQDGTVTEEEFQVNSAYCLAY